MPGSVGTRKLAALPLQEPISKTWFCARSLSGGTTWGHFGTTPPPSWHGLGALWHDSPHPLPRPPSVLPRPELAPLQLQIFCNSAATPLQGFFALPEVLLYEWLTP